MAASAQQEAPPTQQAPSRMKCHCGRITLTFPPLREPALECLCSICRRYGALWAYYKVDEVQIHIANNGSAEDAIEGYRWGKERLSFNRCRKCGCMTHYSVIKDTEPRVAVNCRMLEREEYDRLDSYESDGD